MASQPSLESRVSKLREKISASSAHSNLLKEVAVDTNGLDIMLYQVNFDNNFSDFSNSEEVLPQVQKPKEKQAK